MNILIVDDSKMLLEMSSKLILEHDLCKSLFKANSGEEAIEIVENNEVDIVILDIVMPNIGGVEVLKYIKNHHYQKNIKVIMFTSITTNDAMTKCFELGAFDYINKPINESEFLARIKHAINEKKLVNRIEKNLLYMSEQNEELKELNYELKNMQGQLIQQEKLAGIGQLAAGIAHEINNPLGFVTSNFSVVKEYIEAYQKIIHQWEKIDYEKLTSDEIREKISQIKSEEDFDFINEDIKDLFKDTNEGLSRVGEIVKNLRTFSRIDQMENYEKYNVKEGIENTLVIVNNKVKYIADIEVDLQDHLIIDAIGGELNQVFLNLIVNAADAIAEKGKEMGTIKIRAFDQEDTVEIQISDTGTGISKEKQKDIFNPFFTTKAVGKGTGLGLSISYDIINNKHNGSIEVESEVGEGTTFIIRLPKENFQEERD